MKQSTLQQLNASTTKRFNLLTTFNNYSQYYDLLYRDKDYNAETTYVMELLKKFSDRRVKTILDLGCGTGSFALPLIKKGFRVTGVDLSLSMLKIAREKAQRAGLKVDFHQQNIQKLRLSGKYDAVLAMFAVMGYQTTNRAIDATLQSVRRHLKNSGLFIFDVWYGPAVLWEKPEERIKTVREGNVVIIRKARPVLDVNRHMVTVNYMLQKIVDKKAVAEVHESHAMRFFFYQELCYMLEHNGFKVKSITPCMAYKKKPGINDWNITVVAERC